jgi:hypothetical protein
MLPMLAVGLAPGKCFLAKVFQIAAASGIETPSTDGYLHVLACSLRAACVL